MPRKHATALNTAAPSRPLSLSVTAIGPGLEVDHEAGVIRGVSVITAGQAKPSSFGRGAFGIDATTLQQVAQGINANPVGLKVRVTHPEAVGETDRPVAVDDLPDRVGFIRNARVLGQKVVADVHFHSASDTQAIRLMDIAEHAPESCGLSIVSLESSVEELPGVGPVLRLTSMYAVDWVGRPAANPTGMLSASGEIPAVPPASDPPAMKYTPEQLAFLKTLGLPDGADDAAIAAFVAGLDETQMAGLKSAGEAAPAAASTEVEEVAAATEDETGEEMEGGKEDEDEATAASAAASDRERTHGIMLAAEAGNLTAAQAAVYLNNPAATSETVLKDLRARRAAERSPLAMSVTVGQDQNLDTLVPALEDAISLRANIPILQRDAAGGLALSASGAAQSRAPHARSNDFRGLAVVDMFRKYMSALGVRGMDGMARPQVAGLMLSRGKTQNLLMRSGVALNHSVSDFKGILADVMGKRLRDAYPLAQKTWPTFSRRVTATDFKDIRPLQLGGVADLEEIPEGEEYTYGTLGETGEVYALATYGKGYKWTRQNAINDDLRAFDRLPQHHLDAAIRLEENNVYAILTNNPVMADGHALFSAEHNNLTTGGITVEGLGAARALLERQTALGTTDPLQLDLATVLVPSELRTVAEQLVSSTVDPSRSNATPNPFSGNGQQVISSARLSRDSTTQWYAAAPVTQIDSIEVAFLEGEEAPVIEEEIDFDTDGLKMKIRHTTAAKAIDHRGMVRSAG